MSDKKVTHKIEFKNLSDGGVEVRYFDHYKDSSYRSWRLPKNVEEELISWWKRSKKDNSYHLPIKERSIGCEFNMHTEDYVEIKEFDRLGRFKWEAWTLPKDTVEELISWAEKKR